MMLITIFSSLALTKRRGMMHIFPESLQNFWNNWELRFMVVLSLGIQIILLMFGKRRKFCTKIYLRITLWSAFLFADWFATTSLGILSSKEGENKGDSVEPKQVIVAMWGPLLLLHLGGQDTITAYSMEDNALWSRRLVTYVSQVVIAFLIFLRSWTNNNLNILAIPIFIAGFIKIGERIWVLWCASSQQFKESLFPVPDPGPNYAIYMETYNSVSYEGYEVYVESFTETPSNGSVDRNRAASEGNIDITPSSQTDRGIYGPSVTVRTAHKFLKISKLMFADLILNFQDVSESRSSLLSGNGKEGFEVMEVELGFMYDVFYTKAVIVYSVIGCFLRFVTLACTVSVLCDFFVMEKDQYPMVDVFITSVLLLGAIIFEICSIILLLSSDWTTLWLSMHKNKVTSKVISLIQSVNSKRWCCSIDQFNLISFCLSKAKKKRDSTLGKTIRLNFSSDYGKTLKKIVAKCGIAQMIIGVCQSYQKYEHTNTKIVTGDLKEIIFEHFVNKINEVMNLEENEFAKSIKKICSHKGDKVLDGLESELMLRINDKEKVEKIVSRLSWSVELEFDQSVLLWHIATNLCYNSSISSDEVLENGRSYREASKWLSEYMLYLLIMRPSMLPNGIGEISFQDTCAEATEFVKDRHSIQDEKQVCEMLHKVCRDIDKVSPSKVKGDRSQSVLFDAFRLAKNVRDIKNHDVEWERKEMWKFITQVWVEMLAYAACHCQVIHHAQHLRHGGELLTHVWLLMAHLGITDRVQISKGFGRAKLIKK